MPNDRRDNAAALGVAAEIAYVMEHGQSPEAQAARTLQRFMACRAGEDLVEHGLLRPYGYSLEPGRVMSAYRLLRDTLEMVEVHVASEAHELHAGRAATGELADALAQYAEYMRRQMRQAEDLLGASVAAPDGTDAGAREVDRV